MISKGNDFDVEIDYVIDQIRKASADLVMDMKAHTMKLQQLEGQNLLGTT